MKDMGLNDKYIRAFWFLSNNFGDNLNWFIIHQLSQKYVVPSSTNVPHYIVCGSILSSATEFSTVWGAGFDWEHHRNRDLNGCENVVAVRGDLSAENCGLSVNAIGDPALLLPLLYPMKRNIKHKIGIIPHWSNIEMCINKYPDIFIVNPISSFKYFIENLLSCEYIFSESLHGLIVSDAYGIPNSWLGVNDNVGDGFKYRDYYSSTKFPATQKTNAIDTNNCIVHEYKYNLKDFLNSCPFLNKEVYGLNKD